MSKKHSRKSRNRRANKQRNARRLAQQTKLGFETLEERRMLAVLTVNSLDDNLAPGGSFTLREAVLTANLASFPGPDTIKFDDSLAGGTITLSRGSIDINSDVTISGLGADQLTLAAAPNDRLFFIGATAGKQANVNINGLRLTGGNLSLGNGGAIRNNKTGNLTIANSALDGNSANYGGGIHNAGTLTITGSTLSGNSASNGGAIYNSGALVISDSTLSGNSSSGNGGGIDNTGFGTATVVGSTLSGNSANYGGGIENFGMLSVTGSTVSGNSANSTGGGIRNFGPANISSSTLSDNTASIIGGGIFNSSGGALTLTNSIVANSPSGGDIFNAGGAILGSSNLIEDNSGGLSDTINGDPLLGLLQNNGGPTSTHALLPGSPAIDMGGATVANAAVGGTATQSSDFTIGQFGANLAIDGNPSNFTHTATNDVNPFWQVQMNEDQGISQIVLHNRLPFASRLRDITVEILNAAGSVVFTSPLLNPENVEGGKTLNVGPATLTVDLMSLAGRTVYGRTVRVRRTSDPDLSGVSGVGGAGPVDEQNVLSLAEVEIFTADQRGRQRVIDGGNSFRQDIGAVEFQPTPIANFTQVTTVLPEGTLGFLEVNLGAPVAVSPGILLGYTVSATGGLVQGVDFQTSQLDLSTTDTVPPANTIFIAQGETSARISVAALPDAVDNNGGILSFALLADADPLNVGTGYILGNHVNATIFLQDDDLYTPGIVTTNAFGEASPNLFVDAAGNATTMVKLASQPSGSVVINISTPAAGTLNTNTLNFTTANWDVAQAVTVTGLLAITNSNGQNDFVASLTLTPASSDPDYNATPKQVTIYDEPSETQLKIREGGATQTITPTVSIVRTSDVTEGNSQPASFLVSTDVPAPAGGLRVFYNLTDNAASQGTQYSIVNDSDQPQFGAFLQLNGVDDQVEISTIPLLTASGGSVGPRRINSIEVRVRVAIDQLNQAGDDNVILEQQADDGIARYSLNYDRTTGRIYGIRGGNDNFVRIDSQTDFRDGAFHHVALIRDVDSLKLYVDGNLEASTAGSFSVGDNDSPIYLGRRAGAFSNYFRGEIDEVRFWTTTRNQQNIQQHMNSPLSGNESGLLGYLNFNSSTINGQTVSDQAAGHTFAGLLDGTMQNGTSTGNLIPRFVDIPAGQLSTSLLITAVDDQLAEPTLPVGVQLEPDTFYPVANYQISPTQTTAQINVLDNDLVGIETARLTNIAALDTTFDTDVNVGDLFSLQVTSLNEFVGGATATVQVALNKLPTANIELTISDANSGSTQQLTFTPGSFAQSQSVTLNLAHAVDGGLDLLASTNANGDANYNSLAIDLPFRLTATPFDDNTALAISEAGKNFSFGVRLNSQPTAPVIVTVGSDDTSEGTANATLTFNATNWNTYQVAKVTAVDDNLFDGDKTFNVLVNATSADLAYDPLTATFPLTNQDNESRSNQTINTKNTSDIVATIRPVVHTAGEAVGPGQFEIVLSQNAPVGGLLVNYTLFEGAATAADVDLPHFIEQFGDSNPLSVGHVDQTFTTVGAKSLSVGDLDSDGDLDVLLSLENGITRYFKNVGTVLIPEFEENLTDNPLAATLGLASELGDVDNDGDLDVIQIASANGPIRYFENQLVGTGTFGFTERTGVANPLNGLGSLAIANLSLVDIDGDGQLELFGPRSTGGGSDFFEFTAGAYVLNGASPLNGVLTDSTDSLEFVDWDNDRDFDAFIGAGNNVRYFENVGTRTAPLFVERTGAENPAQGIFGDNSIPAAADLNSNGSLDLLLTRFTSTGPTSGVSEIRYFDASRVQEVLIPAGTSSLIVQIPVIDDLTDEANETLDVALVSRIPLKNGVEAASDFMAQTSNTQLPITVTQTLNAGQVGLQIGTAGNINSYVLEANSQLTFSGGAVGTVATRTVIDRFQQTLVPVTLNSGTAITSGETSDLNLIIGEIVLRANAADALLAVGNADVNFLALSAGDSIPFTGGSTFVVTTPELLNSKTFGDYNANGGAPNGADFLNWQRAVGTTGQGIAADGNQDGIVNKLDLDLWALNFARPAEAGGVTVTGYLAAGTAIAAGETSEVNEPGYRVGAKLAATSAFNGTSIDLQINDAAFTSFTLPAGAVLPFSGGAFATVNVDTLLNSATGTTVPVTLVAGSLASIAVGEETSISSFSIGADQRVSNVTLTLQDNDEAGITVTPSGTITTEAGGTQTLGVVLNTQPSSTVLVNIGVQGDEAVLSDSNQTGQKTVQLVFTPQNWNVEQTITVVGLNDDLDDGDIAYKILTTIVSPDVEYSDDTVPIAPAQNIVVSSGTGNLAIDNLTVPDLVLPAGSQLVFNNGATFTLGGSNLSLTNTSSSTATGVFTGPNRISVNRTAKVHDGDELTRLVVTSNYNAVAGTVGLQIDSTETKVLATTLLAGRTLFFSNGVRATLTADVTLTNSGTATASVTLSGGTAISTTDTSFFEETLIVRTAFDGMAGTVGLEVEDESIAAITFAAGTVFEFSNGTLATLGAQTAFTNATETSTPIAIDANTITTRATAYFRENLVPDLTFTNIDDDTANVLIDRTDTAAAFAEGAANNFFKVVLSAQPTADVVVTLTPSADDIRLNNVVMGEPLKIVFTVNNWNVAQTVEVTVIDDDVVEFDHMRDVTVSVGSTDPVYNSLTNFEKVKVFIEDDDLPTAKIRTVAGAIEANAPGYFVILLDTPVPASAGETGIVVNYTISGTADVIGVGETADVQPIAGTVRIAPGQSQSPLVAFPIDDFKVEGESESVIVTLTANANSRYKLSDSASATLTILDNDIPGVRVVSPSGTVNAVESGDNGELFVSLLSQPTSDVTLTFAGTQATRELLVNQAYTSSATSIGLRINDATVNSLLLPAGDYVFGTTIATLSTATTIFSHKDTNVSVSLNGNIGASVPDRTGSYSYAEVESSNTVTFTPSNWFQLQSVGIAAVDDNVVEKGSFHTSSLHTTVSSTDPVYNNFSVPNQTVNIVDRLFDTKNTSKALTQGFLALQDGIENVELPIIGKFGDVAPPFLETFLEELSSEIRSKDSLTAESLGEAFNVAINNSTGVDNFVFEVTEIKNNDLAFMLSFSDSLMASVNLASDFGLEALNISIESTGTVDLNVDYGMSLGFGISSTGGFYLDTNQTSFSVGAALTLSDDYSATGELGFIQLDITNGIDPETNDTDGTGINASFDITLTDMGNGDGKLTLPEIVFARSGNPFSFISFAFAGNAALDLDVSTSVGGNASFPSFSFNLNSALPLFNYGNDAEANAPGGGFGLNFDDITLDLGEFVTDLLSPVVSTINEVIEPFTPIIEVLTSEVELLSKVGLADTFDQDDDGTATLVEVALTLAGNLKNGKTAAKFTKFVDSITGIIDLTESLSDLEESIAGGEVLAVNFGSYSLENFKGGSSIVDAKTINPKTSGNTSNLSGNATSQTKNTSNKKVGNFFDKLGGLGISLDVIEDPVNAISLFLGQDIDLLSWSVPELDLGFSIAQSFPVFGTIRGILEGEFNVSSTLAFGFDTSGLSQWKENDFAVEDAYLVFDGFYLSDVDPDTGEDVDELTLEATIAAGVKASAVIASITAKGGITGTAGLDLIDVGEYSGESDGRIRGSEIISRISNPSELFEIAGEVEAFLNIAVKVGIDLGFWSIEKTVFEEELARVTLFEFDTSGGEDGNEALAASSSPITNSMLAGAHSAEEPTETSEVNAKPIAAASSVFEFDPASSTPIYQSPIYQSVAPEAPIEITPSRVLTRNELVDLAMAVALRERADYAPAKASRSYAVQESTIDAQLLRRNDDLARPTHSRLPLDSVIRQDMESSKQVKRPYAWEDAFDAAFDEEQEFAKTTY